MTIYNRGCVMQESLDLNFDLQIAQTLLDFFSGHKLIYYKRGEVILRSDDPEDYVFCSKKGYVVSYSISPKGYRDVRSFSRPATFFPISQFVFSVTAEAYLPSRTIYFEALTDAYVWRAPAKEFREFVWSSPPAQTALLKQSSLNHRITMARLEMLQMRDIQLRLVWLLLILALTFGKRKENSALINAPISHQLIADSLSIARETVSRELAKLKRKGLVDYRPNRIVLPDVQKLKQMVEGY